jgi:thymidine kinase
MIKALSGFIIIIDEAGDLNPKVWPYFKRIIDADIPIIFAGLPKVRTFLINEHPDIVSRLKVLMLYPIVVENFIMDYKDFVPEAIEQIYATTDGDMRKFKEVCADCRDKAKELKVNIIDVELALSIIEDFLRE